ncbi:MAG: phenylalanine--tRNA ligase subunit alpha [Candidatus Marinimicrobia bacterium]|nr:phenylalanine--tRNA ligase subunit alpha [Candidatus Neomarinimicrobiota bacterium]
MPQPDLQKHLEEFESQLKDSTHASSLEELRIKYLGRKGVIASLVDELNALPAEDRPAYGKAVNTLKSKITNAYDMALKELQKGSGSTQSVDFDYTLPTLSSFIGRKHPLTQVWEEMMNIFNRMGFEVVRGPEVETEYYNFTALNFPENHPARDMQDTFYITDDTLLRTHTSPVQIRTMLSSSPPVRVVVPGRVYRNEAISARSYCVFNQIEGLYIDKGVSLADLKGTLISFAKQLFGSDVNTRFRPSYFPFTEPSAEMDVSCMICGGKGCRVCKHTGWLELLGAGMVHPNVLKNVDYDPEVYTGFAWGLGIERTTMMRYGINDIRFFYDGDLKFLQQF